MTALPEPTSKTVLAIYESYKRPGEHRPHLGASLIGHECDRYLWLTFRWAAAPQFDGRILRLFETGDLEEYRFVKNLCAIGCEVSTIDQATGRQWRETAVEGHFGSSIDGAALGVPESPKTWHLVEMKTHNAKSFASLKAKGLKESKPQHHAQVIVGMHLHGFDRGLYIAVNKNTDELYSERVYPDPELSLRLLARAERTIRAQEPPARCGGADWYICRFCHFHPLCHGDAPAERNCRTCLHSSPGQNATWTCDLHGECRCPCVDHLYIPALVPGEQVDAGDTWVSYRMRDGSEWVDGA